MGYLDNTTITVDAILTKKGRQLLAEGRNLFNITKFALADDEVDYHLWNPAHPSGSNYYGVAIEEMPVLEPSADETQVMRYKLVSLAKDTVKIPVVKVLNTSIDFKQGEFTDITPNTVYSGPSYGSVVLNAQFGYTAILHNSDVATLSVIDIAPGQTANQTEDSILARIKYIENQINAARGSAAFDSISQGALGEELAKKYEELDRIRSTFTGAGVGMFLGDTQAAKSVFAVGMKFRVTAKQVTKNIRTTITIIGNETGGSTTIPVLNRAYNVTVTAS